MTKQNIFAIIIFIIILATSVMFVNIDKKNRIENYLQQQHKTINTQFNVIYDEKYQLSQIVYNELISNPNIIRIMNQTRKKNSEQSLKVLRNDLYSILNKKYIQWKLLGIQQLHFHLNDNKSFLRMHKPEKFGDDLSNIRESVKLVNQLKTTSHGFEMGRIISGFRFVFPIIADDGSHIGSVEASISTKNFKRELKQSFHSKINFIIKKTIVDKKAFSPVINKQYKTTPINKNFYANKIQQSNISKIPIKILEQIDNKLKKSKTFSVYFKYINGYKTITFYPIHNIKDNEIIAYFVKFNDSEYLTNLYKDFYIILTMLLALSLAIIIYIYNNNVYKSKLAQNIQMIHNQKEELTHTVHELEEQNIQIARQIEEGRKKDTLIAEQSRLASLGEMIGNIAHQWRQPLSAISTSASSLSVQNELGILNNQDLSPALGKIVEKTQFLSQTIEDFRNFIEGKKENVEFVVSSAVDNAFSVVDSSIANHHVTVIREYNDIIFISNYKNEFIQAVLNIINNAKDALDDGVRAIEDRILLVNIKKVNNKAIIIFHDNAGGIPQNIISKIFEPYFTTKHQSQGTGLGLYMTYQIITQSMQGELLVENTKFIHNKKEYFGAKFTIELPMNLEER